MVEGLSLILASPKGRKLTNDFLREIFEEFLTKREEVLPEQAGNDIDPEASAAAMRDKMAALDDDAILERDRKECIALNQRVLDAEREREEANGLDIPESLKRAPKAVH